MATPSPSYTGPDRAQRGVGDASHARELIDLVEFVSASDVVPRPRRVRWDALAARAGRHAERRAKDGPAWSPTRYLPGATRGNAGVEVVSALVLDVDHAAPAWPRLEGLAFAAHTTYSHRPEDPRWRVLLPLARPVPAPAWGGVWRRAVHHLLPARRPRLQGPGPAALLAGLPTGRARARAAPPAPGSTPTNYRRRRSLRHPPYPGAALPRARETGRRAGRAGAQATSSAPAPTGVPCWSPTAGG